MNQFGELVSSMKSEALSALGVMRMMTCSAMPLVKPYARVLRLSRSPCHLRTLSRGRDPCTRGILIAIGVRSVQSAGLRTLGKANETRH